MKINWLCTGCWGEVELDTDCPPLSCCPLCGDNKHPPIDLGDQVKLTVPWAFLQIIVIWAENWAQHNREAYPWMLKMLYQIADRIQVQALDHSGLTLASQVADLRGKGYDVTLFDDHGERP